MALVTRSARGHTLARRFNPFHKLSIDAIIPTALGQSAAPPVPTERRGAITTLAADASVALQELQGILGRRSDDDARVRFPRGYLIEIGRWRLALGFVRRTAVMNNVAYTLMMYDVQTWLLRRTDLAATARDMMVKAAIAALGSIAEAIIVDATSPPMGRRQRMSSRVAALAAANRIDTGVDVELKWLWDTRNRLHLFELTSSEFSFYEADHLPRAEAAVVALFQGFQRGAR